MSGINKKIKNHIENLARPTPPPASSIKESFQFYERDQKKARKIQALWETVLLWSGYDGFFTYTEMAKILHTTPKVISSRLVKFKRLYPEAYEKILEDRAVAGKTTYRLAKSLANPKSYQSNMDKYIVEKF